MKIAVIHNLPPGGMKRALYEQVKRLSRKHALDLYTLSCTDDTFLPLKKFVRKHISEKYDYPAHFPKSVFSIYFKLPKVYQKLAKRINEEKYDVAFVNPCFLTQSPYILKYLKVPTVYQCPEPKREFYEKIPRVSNRISYFLTLPFRLPLKNIDKENARCADRIIVHSQFSKDRTDMIYGVNTDILRLGVDSDFFRVAQRRKDNIVITVGDFSFLKGHDFIIRSLSLIPNDIRPKLLVIGQAGVEKQYFSALARKLSVELQVLENISDQKLLACYQKAKAFVYAPHHEPFGLVALEALSCGLPVISVKDGGISEIITNNRLGILTIRDESDFSQAIYSTIADDKEYDKIIARHNHVKKHWNWEKSVLHLEEYFIKTSLKK